MFQFNVENFSKCLIDYESVKELVGTEVSSLSIVRKRHRQTWPTCVSGGAVRRGGVMTGIKWVTFRFWAGLGPGAGQPALPGTDNNKQQTSRGCPRITCKVLTCLVTLLSYESYDMTHHRPEAVDSGQG